MGISSSLKQVLIGLTTLMLLGSVAQAQITINAANGTAFNPGVRGQNIFCGMLNYRNAALGLGHNTSLRSLPAGGLDADCYNWKTNSGSISYETYKTTLQIMQELRDHKSTGIWTANIIGAGGISGGNWICFNRTQAEGNYVEVSDVSGDDIGLGDMAMTITSTSRSPMPAMPFASRSMSRSRAPIGCMCVCAAVFPGTPRIIGRTTAIAIK